VGRARAKAGLSGPGAGGSRTCHGEQPVGNVGAFRCPSPGQELQPPEAPYLLLHDNTINRGGESRKVWMNDHSLDGCILEDEDGLLWNE
jgi:hypothetical protein